MRLRRRCSRVVLFVGLLAAATGWPRVTLADPPALQVVISVHDRMLWVIEGTDTLRAARVAVASGKVLKVGDRRWHFETPRGTRKVLAKRTDPVWTPPDWHYAEVAREHNLQVRQLPAGGVELRDGNRLLMRDSVVGIELVGDTAFHVLPVDEHIVFDSALFIPPIGSRNRQLNGELGRFALDLGDGYLLHGTPDQESIGQATTHGCIRLADDDLEWVFERVPVGTPVRVR
jgi:lipoprotein-anchoring transpeptidase ErfK/SrfK